MKKKLTLTAFRNFLVDNEALGMFIQNLSNQGNRSLEGHWEDTEQYGSKYDLISSPFVWPDDEVVFWASLDSKFMKTFFN